jgi:hypothetical protein
MRSRLYCIVLAAITAAFITACDNSGNTGTNANDTSATGSAGGTGTGMSDMSPGTSSDLPPANTDPQQSQDSQDMGNSDSNTTTNTTP